MAAQVLIDTGPLVALLDRREEHHHWISQIAKSLVPPLSTCGAVISETCFLLRGVPESGKRLQELVASGVLVSVGETDALWDRALSFMDRYANVPMSFADACMMAVLDEVADARLLTLDRDFLIYRRSDGSTVPLIAPFAE